MSQREAWQVVDDAAVLFEQSFVPALFGPAAAMVIERAGVRAGDRVLDVGCGTGAATREAAKRVAPEGHVAGVDLNPRMLAVARRLVPDVEWREGDAAALPFEDGAFDLVVSQFAMMFFPDPQRALAEMRRVLAPGGRLAVAVCGPLADAPGYAALVEVAERVCSPDVVELLRSPFALGDRTELGQLVCAAELDAELTTLQCPVRFPSIDALVHTEIKASPIRDVIDDQSFAALVAGARERLAPLCPEGGAVAFSMAVHLVAANTA